MIEYPLALILGYVLGAVPFGLLVGKITRGIDVREFGSGKTGTANVVRTVGVIAGLMVVSLDMGKAILAVIITRATANSLGPQVAAALAAVVGHNWSIFIGLKGGRGTAPGFGGLIVLTPLAAPAAVVAGVPALVLSRYVSLGSLAGATGGLAAAVGLAALGVYQLEHMLYGLIAGAIIIFRHADNIQRMLKGQERKLGQKAENRCPH